MTFSWPPDANARKTREIERAYRLFSERFPEAAARVESIEGIGGPDWPAGAAGYTYPVGKRIIYHPRYLKERGGDPYGLAWHEQGHSWHESLTEDLEGLARFEAWRQEQGLSREDFADLFGEKARGAGWRAWKAKLEGVVGGAVTVKKKGKRRRGP